MADRTSAAIFAKIFQILAKNPTEENKRLAWEFWQEAEKYDFASYQMYADEACLILEIAQIGINLDYAEEGEMILFPGDSGFKPSQVQVQSK